MPCSNSYEATPKNFQYKGNQFVKLKLLPIFKTKVFELYVHRQFKIVSQIVKG